MALPSPLPSPAFLLLAWAVQDVADFEWVMWFTNFRNVIVFALSGHVLFAKLCTMVAPQVRGASGMWPAPVCPFSVLNAMGHLSQGPLPCAQRS